EGTPHADAGAQFAAKVRDVSEFLVELGPVAPKHPLPVRATYHDACGLAHAQKIRQQPRQLLAMIPGLELVPLAEGELCCGAAGVSPLMVPIRGLTAPARPQGGRMHIHGIIPPVATPMRDDEELDLPRLKWFIDHLLAGGVHGIFVLGTNSEFYALDEREKQEVIATAVEHVRGRAPVYAGTGAESTREVIRLTRMAEREGVQGVSIITPYFILPNQQEIYDHYRRIAETTSLPVILYNNPATCGGLKIDVDTVARLAQIPNIRGVKDSSGDLQNTMEYIRAVPET